MADEPVENGAATHVDPVDVDVSVWTAEADMGESQPVQDLGPLPPPPRAPDLTDDIPPPWRPPHTDESPWERELRSVGLTTDPTPPPIAEPPPGPPAAAPSKPPITAAQPVEAHAADHPDSSVVPPPAAIVSETSKEVTVEPEHAASSTVSPAQPPPSAPQAVVESAPPSSTVAGHRQPPSPPPVTADSDVKAPSKTKPHRRKAQAEVVVAPHSDSVLRAVGGSDVEGVPDRYDDGSTWLRNGLGQHRLAALVALISGWTFVWIAFWGALFGAFWGVFVVTGLTSTASPISDLIGTNQAVTGLSVLAGIVLGAVGGFVAVLATFFVNPIALAGSLASGALITWLIVVGVASFERLGLRMRGYRRLSRDEVRRIAVHVKEVADMMDLDALPRFAMDDSPLPNAWTHMRTIVLTTALLDLSDGELRAILAHELHHWESGDTVGQRIVWAAALPVALLYDFGTLLSGRSPNSSPSSGGGSKSPGTRLWMSLLGWLIAWPAWILTRWIIAPLMAASQRRYEYEADQAAADIGLASDLISALRKITFMEGGRTGWEDVMVALHPPVALRIEALQPSRPDDFEYQEEDLRGPTRRELRRLFVPPWRHKAQQSHVPEGST